MTDRHDTPDELPRLPPATASAPVMTPAPPPVTQRQVPPSRAAEPARGRAVGRVTALTCLLLLTGGAVAIAIVSVRSAADSQAPQPSSNASLLLTEDEVRSIDGLSEVVTQEDPRASFTENPDPRGPCGASITPPPRGAEAARTFASPGLTIAQQIVDTDAAQHAFLVALESDQHIGCPPHRSMTSAGQSQSVSEITFLEDANNAPGIAWTARADVPGGTGYFGSSVVQVNGRTMSVGLFSLTPIDTATFATLIQLAADKANV